MQLDEELSKNFWEHFSLAKLAILKNKKHFAFIGSMLYKLKIEPSNNVRDVYLDGINNNILVNPTWFTSLTPDESASMLAHEVLHYALQHDIRRDNRIPKIYQRACDQVVNNMLMDFGFKLPNDIEVDRRFQNQDTSTVYRQLESEWDDQQDNGDNGNDNNEAGSNDLPENSELPSNNHTNQRNKAINQADLADRAVSDDSIGNSNEAFRNLFKEINEGKLDWRIILAEYFNELTQGEPSYHNLDRRMLSLGYYEPINETESTIRVALALDVSSSVTEEQIKIFLQEIRAIMNQLNPETVSVMTFNTKILDVFEFEGDEEFSDIDLNIGGGTRFEPIFEHYNKLENKPNYLIVFSDLYVYWDQIKKPEYPTVFICFDSGEEAPFGKTIHINSKDLKC